MVTRGIFPAFIGVVSESSPPPHVHPCFRRVPPEAGARRRIRIHRRHLRRVHHRRHRHRGRLRPGLQRHRVHPPPLQLRQRPLLHHRPELHCQGSRRHHRRPLPRNRPLVPPPPPPRPTNPPRP